MMRVADEQAREMATWGENGTIGRVGSNLAADLLDARAEIARLREALAPFAAYADTYPPDRGADDDTIHGRAITEDGVTIERAITVGDVRRAARAHSGAPDAAPTNDETPWSELPRQVDEAAQKDAVLHAALATARASGRPEIDGLRLAAVGQANAAARMLADLAKKAEHDERPAIRLTVESEALLRTVREAGVRAGWNAACDAIASSGALSTPDLLRVTGILAKCDAAEIAATVKP